MPRFGSFVSSLLATLLLVLTGCAALSDDLQRAEDSFDQARYDQAAVWLMDLEADAADMDTDMRARFYYLRGMTAYRLGERDDALYFLSLAREVGGDRGEGLRPEWAQSIDHTLTELTPEGPDYHARAQTAGGETTAAPRGNTGVGQE